MANKRFRCFYLRIVNGVSLSLNDLLLPLNNSGAFEGLKAIAEPRKLIQTRLEEQRKKRDDMFSTPWDTIKEIDEEYNSQRRLMRYRRRILRELWKYGQNREDMINNMRQHMADCDGCYWQYVDCIDKHLDFLEEESEKNQESFDASRAIQRLDVLRAYKKL